MYQRRMNRRIAQALLLLMIAFVSFYSCEDSGSDGLKGKWQLLQVENSEGQISTVDTVFYSFDKEVFQYLRLETATTNFYCFGNYHRNGNEVVVQIDKDSYQPDEYKGCKDCLGWTDFKRTFVVKKETSTHIELESEGEILRFKKY